MLYFLQKDLMTFTAIGPNVYLVLLLGDIGSKSIEVDWVPEAWVLEVGVDDEAFPSERCVD